MKGGVSKHGHNGVRKFDIWLAGAAWGGVTVELVLAQDGSSRPTLQADWLVRGVL